MSLKLKSNEQEKSEPKKQEEKVVPAPLATPVAPNKPVTPAVPAAAPTASIVPTTTAPVAPMTLGEESQQSESEENIERIEISTLGKILHHLDHIVTLAKENKKISLAVIVAVFVLPSIYQFTGSIYSQQILSTVEDAYAEKNYRLVLTKAAEFNQGDPKNKDVITLLIKSHIHLKEYEKAAVMIKNYEQSTAENIQSDGYSLYSALLNLIDEDIEGAEDKIQKVFFRDSGNIAGHYLRAAIFFYGDNNMLSAIAALEEAKSRLIGANDAKLATAIEEVQFIRQVLWSVKEPLFIEKLPLPFSELTDTKKLKSNDKTRPVSSELEISLVGFRNFYSVPSEKKNLINEELSLIENVLFLQAVAAVREEDLRKAKFYLTEIEQTVEKQSQHYLFLLALLAVKEEDYEQAIALYKKIREDVISVDVNLMLASALWSVSNGKMPTEEIFNLYRETLGMQKDNIAALSNLAYLHLYQGELDKANDLLKQGFALAPDDFYIVYNLSYIDFAYGELEQALDRIYTLRESTAQSQESAAQSQESAVQSFGLSELLAQVLILKGEYREAVAELNKIKEINNSVETYLTIANLYRKGQQPLLIIAELEESRKAFPRNNDILLELLYEYARQKHEKKYNALRKVVSQDVLLKDYRGLLAAAFIANNEESKQYYYTEALKQAASIHVREQILLFWLREVLDAEDYTTAGGILETANSIYESEGRTLPLVFEILSLRSQAGIGEIASKEQLKAAIGVIEVAEIPQHALPDLADVMIMVGQSEEAIVLLEGITSGERDIKRILSLLKRAYRELGDTQRLVNIDRRLTAIKRNENIDTESQYAEASKQLEESGLAYSESNTGKVSSGGGDAIVAIGEDADVKKLNQAIRDKDYETGIAIYTEMLRSGDKRFTPAITHQNRGVLYLKAKRYEDAAQDFQQALDIGENLNQADKNSILYNHALALAQKKDYLGGSEALKNLLSTDPRNLRALVFYGQLLSQLQAHEKAVDVYQKIIEYSPGQIGMYIRLASSYVAINQTEEALAILESALEIAPRNKSVHRKIAELYAVLGNTEKSKEYTDIYKGL